VLGRTLRGHKQRGAWALATLLGPRCGGTAHLHVHTRAHAHAREGWRERDDLHMVATTRTRRHSRQPALGLCVPSQTTDHMCHVPHVDHSDDHAARTQTTNATCDRRNSSVSAMFHICRMSSCAMSSSCIMRHAVTAAPCTCTMRDATYHISHITYMMHASHPATLLPLLAAYAVCRRRSHQR
jgi:hypothetical protein